MIHGLLEKYEFNINLSERRTRAKYGLLSNDML